MKLYRKSRRWLLGFMCLLMCGCSPCDPDPYEINISAECKITDASGAEIAELNLVAGQLVKYCNNWSARAQLSFSVVGFLPGDAIDVTLEPGECVTHTVNDVVDGDYMWSLSCEGYSGGMGGGPVKVDNPPPGP